MRDENEMIYFLETKNEHYPIYKTKNIFFLLIRSYFVVEIVKFIYTNTLTFI